MIVFRIWKPTVWTVTALFLYTNQVIANFRIRNNILSMTLHFLDYYDIIVLSFCIEHCSCPLAQQPFVCNQYQALHLIPFRDHIP